MIVSYPQSRAADDLSGKRDDDGSGPGQTEVTKFNPSAIRDVYVLVRRGDLLLLLLREGTGYKDGEWGRPPARSRWERPTEGPLFANSERRQVWMAILKVPVISGLGRRSDHRW